MSVWEKQLWIDHLRNDIMQFWCSPGCLGIPAGNFPSGIDQNGQPIMGHPHYMRMHGRRIYGYLAAYDLLGGEEYMLRARQGFEWLESHAVNPHGGYWAQLDAQGDPIETAITIQDLSYTVFPYLRYYRMTGDTGSLQKVIDLIHFILDGPYMRNGKLVDSLSCDYSEVRYFEGNTLNVVSLLDLMNLLIIPMADMYEKTGTFFPELPDILERLLDQLVTDYYCAGIFWNDLKNRSDYSAKHVDLGHTSKAYGILFRANRYLEKLQRTVKYRELEKNYPPIVHAASDPENGWLTDFADSAGTFRRDSIQWWRYILIDQTVALYAGEYPELTVVLENGLRRWFELPFVDRTRDVRGICEGLRADGSLWSCEDGISCKANLWKSAYHEVEHVEDMLAFISRNNVV